MIIKSLKIYGFGKHKNFDIKFSDGLNIVYGSNEAGKSTLQAFIKAMFYGFGPSKRNVAENPRKKYTPWNTDIMGGEIIFQHNSMEYSLIRKFGDSKSKDKVVMSLTSDGAPIALNSKSEPGEFLFNISQATFESTLFVGQLDSKIDSDKAKNSDILSKLSNLAGTGDESVNINFIEGNLTRSMNAIHSARGQNGLADKLKVRISQLNEELEAFNSAKNTSLRIMNDLSVYTARKESIIEDIEKCKKQIRAAEINDIIQEFNKIKEQKNKQAVQERLLKEVKALLTVNGRTIDRIFYEECLKDFELLENAENKLSGPDSKLSSAKETLSSIDEKLSSLEYINHFDIEVFEELISLKNELSRSIEKKKNLDLRLTDALVDMDSKTASLKTSAKNLFLRILPFIISGGLCAAGAVLFKTLPVPSYIMWGSAGLILLVLLSYYIIKSGKNKERKTALMESKAEVEKLNGMQKELEEDIKQFICSKSEAAQNKIREIFSGEDISLNSLEHKYTLISKHISSELENLNCISSEDIRNKLAIYNSYKVQKEEVLINIASLSEEYKRYEKMSCDVTSDFFNKYSDIFPLASIEDIRDGLQNIFHNLNRYDSLNTELKYSNDYLRNLLKGRSFEELQKNAEAYTDGDLSGLDIPSDPALVASELESLEKDLNNIKEAISDTNVRIASNFKFSRDESEIISDINELSEYSENLEYQYNCMKIAKDTIKEAFEEVQQSFGPKLNNRASEILNTIKPDNPVSIKVSRDFNITLSPRDSLLPYDIDYFSYGAQDQAYFALRMAISDILSADFEGFPLLLDDPFVQYDEKRMQYAVNFLSEVSKTRQVFIFTCHKNVAEYSGHQGANLYEMGKIS